MDTISIYPEKEHGHQNGLVNMTFRFLVKFIGT